MTDEIKTWFVKTKDLNDKDYKIPEKIGFQEVIKLTDLIALLETRKTELKERIVMRGEFNRNDKRLGLINQIQIEEIQSLLNQLRGEKK